MRGRKTEMVQFKLSLRNERESQEEERSRTA